MVPSEFIEATARAAYARGRHPVDVAQAILEVVTEETLHLDCHDPHVTLLARRIIGAMLDLGWSAPPGPEEWSA